MRMMLKGARCTISLLLVSLVAACTMLGSIMVAADTTTSTATSTENIGIIEAIVWYDGLIPDKSEAKEEGINGIKVQLYKESGTDASGNILWEKYGEPLVTAPGQSKVTGETILGGLVTFENLPVVKPYDIFAITRYKLALVPDPSYVPLNGSERVIELHYWNSYNRWYFQMGDPGQAEQPAFEIQNVSAVPVENIGKIEVAVWDDLVLPNVSEPKMEGVDGITVNLYKLDESGNWQLYGSKKTGYGGFFWTLEHGWAGWSGLPVMTDWRAVTRYKLQLVTDNTFNPLNGTERIVDLNITNLYYRWFFELGEDAALRAFQISSTTGTISGIVWYDANADQVREWHEPVQSGWTIVLTDRYGRKVASTKTDARGYYQFRGLKAGTYKVWVAEQSGWKQVYPYYKLLTIPPWGCEKGHHTINVQAGKYYVNNDFGMLSMKESIWATLYYGLWWIGLLQYQFQ